MKTPTEIKFNKIVKEGFHEILKPIGFKKKGNNFFIPRQDLGQIINIQKSIYYSKDNIHFTINTGLFISEFWLAFYNYAGSKLPIFPTEPDCLIRKRIGELRNQQDTWYDVTPQTDENHLIKEMQENVNKYILPYFEDSKTLKGFINLIDNEKGIYPPLGKLIIYGEFQLFEKARIEYHKLLAQKNTVYLLESINEYGQKYGLQ